MRNKFNIHQVTVGLYFVYGAVGHAVWAGVAMLGVIFVCTSIISKQMQKLQVTNYFGSHL
jgi:hypothetical protein